MRYYVTFVRTKSLKHLGWLCNESNFCDKDVWILLFILTMHATVKTLSVNWALHWHIFENSKGNAE